MRLIETASDLKVLRADMDTIFGTYHHETILDDERYYNLDIGHLLQLPKKFRKEAVVLPTGRDVVESATDHVNPQYRMVRVPRKTVTERGTDQARKLQRFYEALLNHLERQSYASAYHDAVKQLALYGIGVGKFTYDQFALPSEPSREDYSDDTTYREAREDWNQARTDTMPFRLQTIHPAEVRFDLWHDPPQWVLQVSQRYVGEILATYPNWDNRNHRSAVDKVEVLEYWSTTHRAILADESPALKTEDGSGVLRHRWGDHPYIIIASGYGIDDSEHKPEYRFVGLLRFIRDVLRSESRNYSIADIVMKAGAWPVRVAEGERANEMPALRLEYGTVQPLPPGVTMRDLTPQLPPQLVFSFLQIANNIISSSVSPRIVRGLGQPGLTSGFDRQLALGEARLRYGALAFATEMFLTAICRKSATYMQNVVPSSISIASAATQDEFVEVSAKDFKGNHAITVKVNVLEPEDEIRKHQDVATLVTSGLMSPQKGIEKVSPDVDPETELSRIVGARLLFSPQVLGVLSQIALERVGGKLGVEETISRILAQAQGGEPGGMAAGRTPPTPETIGEGRGRGSRQEQAAARQLDLRETGGPI